MNYWRNVFIKTITIKTQAEWDKLGGIMQWLIVSRISAVALTFFAGIITLLLTIKLHNFNLWQFLLVFIGLLAAHSFNNLFNDYVDHRKNVDKAGYYRAEYGTHLFASGFSSNLQKALFLIIPGLIGLFCATFLIISSNNDIAIWLLVLIGVIFVLFYTWPLKYLALGEVSVFVVWGLLMIPGGYYVISGSFDSNVFLTSIAYGLSVTAVIFGKHTDKIVADTKAKIYTLPTLIGEKASRFIANIVMILPYLILLFQIINGFYSAALLGVLISLPQLFSSIAIYSKPRPKDKEEVKNKALLASWPLYYVRSAFLLSRSFSLYLVLGLILDLVYQIFLS